MRTEDNTINEHEKFKELGALADTGVLTPNEWSELQAHLQICASCSESCRQYRILAIEGFPLLADRYTHRPEQGSWNDGSTRKKLFARVTAATQQGSSKLDDGLPVATKLRLLRRRPASSVRLAWAALVACLMVGLVGLVAYRLGNRERATPDHDRISAEVRFQKLAADKKSLDELLYRQTMNLSQLREQSSQKEQELAKLRTELRRADNRVKQSVGTSSTDVPLNEDSKQRDALRTELRDSELAYQNLQEKLGSLVAERDKALLQIASLNSTTQELAATNRDLERQIIDDEEYLASDRDVRELMGARKLYIADVFDVDGRSRTRKPFGRIFYTQGKSLLFYAFDLEEHPDLKKMETFQAWGRNDSEGGKPLNLGIFYMDSETNRRWVLRFDDPAKLSEINAVFVTVEPDGGSRKPTGKPFLYALLRKEANHP